MTREQVVERVRSFVCETFLYMRPNFDLAIEDSLMGTGVVDSMGVMEVISFLEEEFGVVVADHDVTEANLGTLNAIARYVITRRGTADQVVSEPTRSN